MTDAPDAAPHAVWSGTFRLFGVDVRCHTLSDGQRVIDAESIKQLMEAMAGGAATVNDPDVEKFERWRRGR